MVNRKILLTFILFLVCTPFFALQTHAAEPDTDFDRLLAQLRSEFFAPVPMARGLSDTPVTHFTESVRNFEHISPPDMTPYLIPSDGTVGITPSAASTGFNVGDRRQFNASGLTPVFGHWGQLVRQGDHVNIWILDNVPSALRPNDADLNAAIIAFDDIFIRMSADFAPFEDIAVTTHFGNMPTVGDLHDGRVNVLLHTGRSGGYFSTANYMTNNGNIPIAVFHMHPSFLISSHDNHAFRGSLFAHEFQHLLFYLHFGVYLDNPQEYLWLNEALSELAWVYWGQPGSVMLSHNDLFAAAVNPYSNPDDPRVGDFINFNNSDKNYAMGMLKTVMLHRRTPGDFASRIYNFFSTSFPRATNSAMFANNRSIVNGATMAHNVGNAYAHAGLLGSTGATGTTAFNMLYFLFMENFAADGGKIISEENEISTTKFIDNLFSANNLWGIRPNLGIATSTQGTVQGINGVFEAATGGFYSLASPPRTPFSNLANGGRISLTGYNSTPSLGATHEMFYRLTGQTVSNPVLNISVSDSGTTFYYVVVPNDAAGSQSSSANRQFGRDGASVYPISRDGTANFIDTRGQNAYLFVSTIFRTVRDIPVAYTWANAMPARVTGVTVSPPTANVRSGATQNFSAVVLGTNNPSQNVIWSVENGTSGTNISSAGVLTVAANETAASLTVRATSALNTNFSGVATVTVLAATIVYTEAQLRAEVANAGSAPKTILLAEDIVLGEPLEIPGGADIILQSVGEMKTLLTTVDYSPVIGVRGLGRLTIDGIIISREIELHPECQANDSRRGPGIVVASEGLDRAGHLTILNGYITMQSIGVENAGTTIMNGGKIFGNNYQGSSGSGVRNHIRGTFTMNGGEISDNIAVTGGGVYNSGTFNMNGGKIFGNTAIVGGGVDTFGTFNMSGGEISDNIATDVGGGIFISPSRLREPGNIFIGENAIFANNFSQIVNMNQIRLAQDDAIYNSQIRATRWSAPFTQGFNNFDISYAGAVSFRDTDGRGLSVNHPDTVIVGEPFQRVPLGGAAIAPRVSRLGWVVSGWNQDGDFDFVTDSVSARAQWSRLGAFGGASATSGDATWLARHLAGHASFGLTERARLIFDMNGDGEICTKDLTILVQWLVGYDLAEII
jgi:hypothetical protein